MRLRYNIAPYSAIPVIRGETGIDFFKWGFIPSWMPSSPNSPIKGYINARAETVFEKPAFKWAVLRQRCIIPATGYYEWMQIKDRKLPYYISLKPQSESLSSLFGMAGIWDSWQDQNGIRHDTCAIITVLAHPSIAGFSDRMPLILSKDQHKIWLAKKIEPLVLQKILDTPLQETYHTYPVSPRMNNPDFDTPQCMQSL